MREQAYYAASYHGVRVAVLGAAGFIGRWVARALCLRGAKLHLVVRDREGAEKVFSTLRIHGETVKLDLEDFDAVRVALRAIAPSITFNLAGYGVDHSEQDEATAYRVNADLVGVVCEAVAGSRAKGWQGRDIVHVGSAFEYGSMSGNLCEDAVPTPTSVYGKSKLAGTLRLLRQCEATGIKGLVARPFTVYGAGEYPERLLPSLLRTAKTGNPLPLSAGWQERDFTYVEDVAEGLVRLGVVPAEANPVVNLATGHLTSVRTFVETAAEILHIPLDKLEFGAMPLRVEETHSKAAVDRLRELTGWVPATSIAEGIRRTSDFEWRVRAEGRDTPVRAPHA